MADILDRSAEEGKNLKFYHGLSLQMVVFLRTGFGKDYLPNKTMEQLCKGE